MASPFVKLDVGGRTVKVTNPDKVFYRKLKATKLDHVQYYISVGDGIVRALYELRIDVDPQPGTTFKDAKRVAGLVREVLDELGFVGWPKTSGNRGIHIACRIEPEWSFPEVRRCALAFAREVERRLPKKVTTAWWKEQRGERVFIDYNQNARDRTIASAYSVRARVDATV